jgi:hypothetical protein
MKTILIEVKIDNLNGLKHLLKKMEESALKGIEIGRGSFGDSSFVYKMSYDKRRNYTEKNIDGIKQKIYRSKMNKIKKK